jgi:hypothetical protein
MRKGSASRGDGLGRFGFLAGAGPSAPGIRTLSAASLDALQPEPRANHTRENRRRRRAFSRGRASASSPAASRIGSSSNWPKASSRSEISRTRKCPKWGAHVQEVVQHGAGEGLRIRGRREYTKEGAIS